MLPRKYFLVACIFMFGCEDVFHSPVVPGPPGEPLVGLDAEGLARFNRGRALFNRPFTPDEGLGPLFNQDRCSSCHDLPAIGGAGEETATKATRFIPPNTCDELVSEGGSTVQERATPLLRAQGVHREARPPSATVSTTITSPSLFGLGLIEAVPLSTLERLADPDDADGDGISGRIGHTTDGRPARFGRKGEFASIVEFVEAALRFEMGLTTPEHPNEETLNGAIMSPNVDPAPDPEVTQTDIELLTDFVRFLGPTSPFVPSDDEDQAAIARGSMVFNELGCPSCHVRTLVTGPTDVPALSERAFDLYSDLLLHDMGPRLATICGPAALPSEFRTAQLVGLRNRPVFLHDGSAGSVWGAIVAHAGEASRTQASFLRLGVDDQNAVVSFVSSR